MLKIIGQPWHLIFFNLHASTYTQTLIANFASQLHKIRINIPSQILHSIYHRFNENTEIPFFKLTYIISSQIKDLILKFSREAQPRKKCRGLHVLLRKHFEKKVRVEILDFEPLLLFAFVSANGPLLFQQSPPLQFKTSSDDASLDRYCFGRPT